MSDRITTGPRTRGLNLAATISGVLLYASAVLAVVGLAARLYCRSWIAPATIFPLFWAIVFDLADKAHYGASTAGIWVIALLVSAASAGSVVHMSSGRIPEQRVTEMGPISLRRLQKANLWLNLVGFAGIVIITFQGLHRFGLGYSPGGLRHLGNAYSAARYGNGTVGVSSLLSFVAAFIYPGAAISLYRWHFTKGWRQRWKLLAPVALILFYAYITAEHSNLLFGGAFAAGGFLAGSAWRRPISRAVSMRAVVFVAVALIVVPVALGFITKVRSDYAISSTSQNQRSDLYLVGSVPAFASWYDNGPKSPGWGINTFAGPANALHFKSRPQGLYDQSVTVAQNEFGAPASGVNVYTAFRPLIADFTLPGAVLIMFAFGIWAAAVFDRVRSGGRRSSWGLLATIYVAILISSVVTPFAYNNIAVDLVLVVAIAIRAAHVRLSSPEQTPMPSMSAQGPLSSRIGAR